MDHLDRTSSHCDRVSDIGQPHDAVVSRTATMMGASVEQAGRWNIEMVELHISTVCQILDSRMLGVVTALFSTMCQNQIPTSNSLHTCMKGHVGFTSMSHDWCLCTACSLMEHLYRRSTQFDRVSDIPEPHTTATFVEAWCSSLEESLPLDGVTMMLCPTLYAIGNACRAKVLKP